MVNLVFSAQKVLGRRCFQYVAAITCSLGILSSEMHFGWSSPSLPLLTNGTYFFQVSDEEASWLAVAIFPGIVCGALFSSYSANALGRKNLILITSPLLFTSWLIMALARSDLAMFLARYLGGVGGGLSFSNVPMYLGEISEPGIRGLLSSLCPVCVVMGILLINVLGIYLSIDVCAFLACLVPLFMFSTFVWMPESPVLLIAKGQSDKARRSLTTLRGEQEGDREFDRLCRDLEDCKQEQQACKLMELFQVPVNRRALLIALGLRSVQQLCGSTAITFYCKTIFHETEEVVPADLGAVLYFTLQAVFAVLSSFVVDFFGRRPLFLVSLAGTTATLFLTGAYMALQKHLVGYKFVPILNILLNVSFFNMGVRIVPLLTMSEVFHPDIKPTALCFATIYYAVLAIVVTKLYQFASQTWGMAWPLLAFGVLSLISWIAYYFYVPETKGKTLEDIQKMLKDRSVNNGTSKGQIAAIYN